MRKRPGMYIGGKCAHGLRHMLDHIVTEQLNAPDVRPTHVRCTLEEDGFCMIELRGELATIEDNHFIVTDDRLVAGNFLLSLGIASAFSERLDVEANQHGKRWQRSFAAGLPTSSLEIGATSAPSSLRIRLRPDRALFKNAQVSFLALCARAQEWAIFYPSIRFCVDGPDGQRRDYHYPAGLLSYAEEVEHNWFGYQGMEHWRCQLSEGKASAEVIIVHHPNSATIIHTFVNGLRTLGGGTQVDGLRAGFAKVSADLGDTLQNPFQYEPHPLESKTVLLAVHLEDPSWANSTKDALDDDRGHKLVYQMITTQLPAEIQRVEAARGHRA